ncbi:type ISP restriction/modification enzyme [Sorangium sp. So ce887]|uniref:type ISP restriction/modification enzyme n=1 Tax=Sorangium sp. So ce887 TaxID=3133324 RepID=UPI003F5F422A
MPELNLRPNHKVVQNYYQSLRQYSLLHATHEGAVSEAFGSLLQNCARQFSWMVVNQYEIKRRERKSLRVDGALVDPWSLAHGYWEAKDQYDDLAVEAKKKIDVGYPTDNIIFQAPDRAILYQGGKRILDEPIKEPSVLVDVVKEFFRYQPPVADQWERAVAEFREKVPQLGAALLALIEKERRENPLFLRAFDAFVQVCRRSLNPALSETAVEKMLAQHILTERIFRKVFDNPDFVRRNVIACEIEKVIDSLTQRSFNRGRFLAGLDRFYSAIEETAGSLSDFSAKQAFLNTVYENFFQGFDAKTADTHGIVYTPQPIVKFMVKSVDDILKNEFGRSLGDPGVHILDPFVGTGNFLLHVMRHIPKSRLPRKYASELHANEVMLLPYYIASMNIEHEYTELAGEHSPFDGLCLVDTFELAEPEQQSFSAMTERNAERVERQRKSPITIIIGNPPYNAWQADENDNNKNRKYKHVDGRVAKTYAKDSAATLVNSLSDPYVKAFRWATDRIGEEGVLAYVSNNSYVEQLAFDGMRKHLVNDFDAIYVLDLGGNVRKNPKLSGTTHNVFGIQVGVAIGFFVRRKQSGTAIRRAKIYYARVGEDWRKEAKYSFLDGATSYSGVEWTEIVPDSRSTWITSGLRSDFDTFTPLVCDDSGKDAREGIFRVSSNGVKSNNDAYVCGFDRRSLEERSRRMVEAYNTERLRWVASGRPDDIDGFLKVDEKTLKWVRKTKRCLARGLEAKANKASIVECAYRPFARQFLFLDKMFSEDVYWAPRVYGSGRAVPALVVAGVGNRQAFGAFMVNATPALDFAFEKANYLPIELPEHGDEPRSDNITDWALETFRRTYSDNSISKRDVFYYVYAVLHHGTYRERYKDNLKRELPRIPFAPNFRAFSDAGKRLAELHVDFEKQPEYTLKRIENPKEPLNWRVEKMRLTRDRQGVIYNNFLTLSGIPVDAFEYRIGNRSAIDWVIDQYMVSTDKRSGITNDPNRRDDPEFIVRLIGQIVTVSVETVKIVRGLPALDSADADAREAAPPRQNGKVKAGQAQKVSPTRPTEPTGVRPHQPGRLAQEDVAASLSAMWPKGRTPRQKPS